MYQTPRTPHARDNASLDPGQDADDADGENDDLYGDENVDTGREQEAPPTGKRGRASKTDQGNRSFRSTVSSISVCESPSAATVCSRTHQYDPSQPCSHFARPLCRGNIGFRLNPGREPY